MVPVKSGHVLMVKEVGLQIGSAEQYAQAGDVILSPEVAGVTAGHCTVTPLEGNNARLVSMSHSAVVSDTFTDLATRSLFCQVLHANTLLCDITPCCTEDGHCLGDSMPMFILWF